MQHDFWHQRWENNQIGFHNPEVNSYLQRFWSLLDLKLASRVFVPLCGKSKDLLWLLTQGYQIVGVELSTIAVKAFFAEHHMQPTIRQVGDFTVYEVTGLQIFCGDYFKLTPSVLGNIDAVYDRAALVALPSDLRLDYVNQLASLITSTKQILLVSFDYPQAEMSGPPFSVPKTEVELYYQPWCSVELLISEDTLQREKHFQERGLLRLNEDVYRLIVR